ncbi:hypothetical protein [Mangrovihabitans endophyticus]|nr:hypothetical protein [Mangrovihabitans endophyticus]
MVTVGCADAGHDRADTVDQPAPHGDGQQTSAREVSAAKAKDALLTVTDLPTGWSAKPDTSSSAKGSLDDDGDAQCPKYAAVIRKTAAMDDISAGFVSPSGTDVVEGILPLTEPAARELVTEYSDAVTACQKMTSTTADGVPYELYLTALSFPKLGDDTFALRTTATLSGITINVDLALIRRGGALIFVVQTARGAIDTATTQDVGRRALAKMNAVAP